MGQYITSVVKGLVSEIVNKVFSTLLQVIVLRLNIIDDRLIRLTSVEIEGRWSRVVIVLHVREDVMILSTLLVGPHDHFHLLFL